MWVFQEEAVQYPFACNDGYTVLLFKDKTVIDHFKIHLRCRAFVHDKAWLHMETFSPAFLSAKNGCAIRYYICGPGAGQECIRAFEAAT